MTAKTQAKRLPGWVNISHAEFAEYRDLKKVTPELLEALKLMVGYPGHGKSVEERLEIAKAAIAKAAGRE